MPFFRTIENSKNLKNHASNKRLALSFSCGQRKNEDEKLFKEQESIEILKTLDLIENI